VTGYLDETRVAYDTVAVDYATQLADSLTADPFDRAALGLFAELVGDGPVLEVGCGPGRITGYLASLGVDVSGLDLSPRMVEVARAAHPDLRFSVGTMTSLEVDDGALAGLVAWFSIIHLPPDVLPVAFAEFRRVVRPGGHVVLVFQIGDERVRVEQAYGHAVQADAYRLVPDRIVSLLTDAGFTLRWRTFRAQEPPAKTPAAYLIVH
jgi:SAM-dependent methyltransferase